MKIIIAMDSFKGSLSSLEAGRAIKEAISSLNPLIDIQVYSLADGGEGSVEALVSGCNGHYETIQVHGPLNDPVMATYGILEDHTAVIEMAQASGLTLVPTDKRNPLYTSTIGVGELILDAYNKGCRKYLIGIGGSATNDGGAGMLSALGYQLLDKNNQLIEPCAQSLEYLSALSDKNVSKELLNCEFLIACDVKNPLCGPNGASAIYGPQKGSTEDMIEILDSNLRHYSNIIKKQYPDADPDYPGSGAAGGLGFAFKSILKAQLRPGIELIMNHIQLEKAMSDANLVITGEGKLDGQSIMGKTPIGVAKLAKKQNIPVILYAGCLGENADTCLKHGIDAYYSIIKENMTIEEAMKKEIAIKNLKDKVLETITQYL